MSGNRRRLATAFAVVLVVCAGFEVRAQGPWPPGAIVAPGPPVRVAPGAVIARPPVTHASETAIRPPGRLLGTFYPEPTVNIMGSNDVRGGYAPLDMYGLTPLALYGPTSVYRVKTAPVLTYTRGYDGLLRPSVGVSLSYPNYPIASPVVYPTRANSTVRPLSSRVPPWWQNAQNWLDQN